MTVKLQLEIEEHEGAVQIKVETDLNECSFQEMMIVQVIQQDLRDLINRNEIFEQETVH